MAHFVNRAAEDKIANKAMTVGGHGDEITLFPLGGSEDLRGRIAQGQVRRNVEAVLSKVLGSILQIFTVHFHFL